MIRGRGCVEDGYVAAHIVCSSGDMVERLDCRDFSVETDSRLMSEVLHKLLQCSIDELDRLTDHISVVLIPEYVNLFRRYNSTLCAYLLLDRALHT